MIKSKENIFEMLNYSDHPWKDFVDIQYDALNRKIRKEIEKQLNLPPTPREEEIKRIAEEEKKKYELDKLEFESNPLHWTNNKRKRKGLPVLRGRCNKNRQIKFRSFYSPRLFFLLEDIIEETLSEKFQNNDFFNDFVEVKNISYSN